MIVQSTAEQLQHLLRVTPSQAAQIVPGRRQIESKMTNLPLKASANGWGPRIATSTARQPSPRSTGPELLESSQRGSAVPNLSQQPRLLMGNRGNRSDKPELLEVPPRAAHSRSKASASDCVRPCSDSCVSSTPVASHVRIVVRPCSGTSGKFWCCSASQGVGTTLNKPGPACSCSNSSGVQ